MIRAMNTVYVAGPYSAPDSWQREQNIRAAEFVSFDLMRRAGPVAVICVHSMARYWYGAITEAEAIAADDELLLRSDAVVLVTGWWRSKGTQAEIRLAQANGIPVYMDVAHYIAKTPSVVDCLIAQFV